jgi:hypothetical protein
LARLSYYFIGHSFQSASLIALRFVPLHRSPLIVFPTKIDEGRVVTGVAAFRARRNGHWSHQGHEYSVAHYNTQALARRFEYTVLAVSAPES